MAVSFVASDENKECPVCLKDKKIAELQLTGKFLAYYFFLGMDNMRLVTYDETDKEEINRKIEKVQTALKSSPVDLSVKILEQYYEARKTFPWVKTAKTY
jgi:hypothetical protein